MAMKCSKCGRENIEGASFCSVCGNPIAGGSGTAYTMQQPVKPKSKTGLIIAIVAIVVIVIVVLGAIAAMSAVHSTTTTKISMTVVSAEEVVGPSYNPPLDSKYVQITVTMTNTGHSLETLNPFGFSLLTSDGSSYPQTYMVDDTVPESLNEGSTSTFSLAFEVPDGKTPTKLTYHDVFSTHLFEAAIVTVTPAVVKIILTVTEITDATGSYSPSSGNKYVLVAFEMRNDYNQTMSLSPYDFKLQTANGTLYSYSIWVDHTIPSALAAGGNGAFSLGFEVPTSATLQKFVYQDGSLYKETSASV